MTKSVKELIGSEATERLRERLGDLVDGISIKENFDVTLGHAIVRLELRITDLKSFSSSNMEWEIGVGIAEIRQEMYRILEIGKGTKSYTGESHICLDNKLPTDIVLMHPKSLR